MKSKGKYPKRTTIPWVLALLLTAAASLLLSGCSQKAGAGEAETTRSDSPSGKAPAASATPAEPVPTTTVLNLTRNSTVLVTGSLEGDEQSQVACKRGGIILRTLVERGSLVKKGDILLELDPVDARNALAEGEAAAAELKVRLGLADDSTSFVPEMQPDVRAARAAVEWAEANYRRDKDLVEHNVLSKGDFDKSRTDLDAARQRYNVAFQTASQLYQSYLTARARLKTLRQNLEDTTIRAPFDGLIVERLVSAGEAIRDFDRVVRLVRIVPMRLKLSVPERFVGDIRIGQKVRFEVGSVPGRTFEGTIKYLAPGVSMESRAMVAEAMVDNLDQALRPGFFASAHIEIKAQEKVCLVPASAIRREGEVTRVFVVENGIAREKVVQAGIIRPSGVEISAGLSGGESIIADIERVTDGMPVTVK